MKKVVATVECTADDAEAVKEWLAASLAKLLVDRGLTSPYKVDVKVK